MFSHHVSNGNITSIYFSSQFNYYPYDYNFNGLFTPVGIFTKNLKYIFNNLTRLPLNEQKNFVKNLEGQFALGYSDFDNQELILYTHIARIETLYLFKDKDLIIVGTDPMLISVIAGNGKAEVDIQNMYSFLQNGYYADDKTPFKHVYALPANSYIKVNETGVLIENIDDLYDNLLNIKYNKHDYDNLTDLFLNSFNTQNKDNEFKLALTGGKDSRLIFAAMNSNNFKMSTFTNGFLDSPDVIIAKKISEMYKINHNTYSPKISDENTINVNIYNRIKKVMFSTSGLVYGYENVSMPGKFKGNKSFDGVGAELVKGGFASFINSDNNSNKTQLVRTFNKNQEFFTVRDVNPFANFLDNFIQKDIGLHKLQIIYSLFYRSGRLTSAAKNSSNYIRQSHSPFLDNYFLREALKVDYQDIKNEQIHYQIMTRLDKKLIDVPFGKDRWRIEKDKPINPNDYYKWLNRSPYYPSTILGNYNWRKVQNNDSKITKEFRNILLSDQNHPIYEIVNYNAVENMFNKPLLAKNMRFVWSLASIIIFINELNFKSNQNFNNTISIKLPSTNVKQFKQKKKIIDITKSFISLNQSLCNEDNQFIVRNYDMNRILKLYTGVFAKPPKEISLNSVKKLRIHINIESLNASLFNDLKLQVLFYNNDKRSKTYSKKFIKSSNLYDAEFEFDTEEKHDSFRILINLNSAKVNDKLRINYAFYEITH